MAKRWRSIFCWAASLSALLAFAAWLSLRGSLPLLDGEAALAGLGNAVEVTRDRDGVVTVEAADERDAARAWAMSMRRSAISKWT